jgi:hypothetical protein
MHDSEEAHTDIGSVLPSDSASISIDKNGRVDVFIPKGLPEDEDMPDNVLLAVAIATRALDPEWVSDMLAWMDQQLKN